MSAEIKSTGKKIETIVSKGLAKKFKSYCRKMNISMAQRLRDLMQKEITQK